MAELKFEITKEFIDKWGKDTIIDIIKRLQAVNADATGRLIKSLSFEIQDTVEGIFLKFKADDYFKYVEDGRKPGKIPPISEILAWTKVKGIPRGATFAIAKNIGKFGITPRPVLSEIINNNKFNKNEEELEIALTQDIENFIDNNIIKK